MPAITLVFAAILIGMGLFGYLGADDDNKSVTALIPAFVGALLGICGLVAFSAGMRKHAMHAAAMLGLLGFIAAAGRLASKGGVDLGARGDQMLLGMAVVCFAFVALCVNSFIAARKRRQASDRQTGK